MNGWTDYIKKANEETIVKIAIEDREGLAALPEIVKIPDVDLIEIGTNDLSMSMGYAGQPKHPAVVAEVEKVLPLLRSCGKPFGIGNNRNPEDLKASYAMGARWLLTNVGFMLRNGIAPMVESFKTFT